MPRAIVVHVATTGTRLGDGSERRPFPTLVAARDALRRKRRTSAPSAPVEVHVAAGVYRLDKPLVFTPEDGGTARCPVTWMGVGGRAMLSGGRALGGWTTASLNGVPCWQTTVPEVAAGGWWFTQLFVNGRRRLRSRWPKRGFLHFSGVPEEEAKRDPGGFFHGAMSAHYAAGDLPTFSNLDDIDVVVPDHWYENHLRLASIDAGTRTIHFATKGYSRFSRDETGRGTRYRFDHVREACSDPGDWYLDRASGTLSYIPMPGELLVDALIEAPRLDRLIDVAGDALDATKRVQHLRFQFLDLRHCEWELPRENAGTLQSDFQVPAAVRFVGATDCALYACRVSQVAGWAVEVLRGCERNRVVGCALHDLGGGGVKIGPDGGLPRGWQTNAFRGLDAVALGWGPAREDAGGGLPGRDVCASSATTVSDCSIHHGGLIFHSAIGVWIGDASRNRVVHNHIHDFYYSGISCGWTWGFAPAHAHDNRIEANRINAIGQGVLSDMGAIYTLGRQAGTTVCRNVISEVRSYGYGGWGIYPDEGSSWMTISENVVSGTKCGGFHQHYGRDNLVTRNLFLDASENQIQITRDELVRGVIFTGNLVQGAGNGKLWQGEGWAGADIDRNVYAGDPGQRALFAGGDWATWQRRGHDRAGALGDACLLDATALGVASAAPATLRRAGIAPATVAQVLAEAGPRLRGALPASIDGIPPEVEIRRPIVETMLWPWPAAWPIASDATRPWSQLPQVALMRAGKPRAVSLTVHNRGDAPAVGAYRLRVVPASAARIIGPVKLPIRLKPGARCSLDVTVLAKGKATRFRVEAIPSGDHLPSSVIHCLAVRATSITIPRLPAEAEWSALAHVAAHPVDGAGVPLVANARLAVAGGRLLLRVDTSDAAPSRGANPWDASCVELFVAPQLGAPAIRVVMVPAVADLPARIQLVSKEVLSERPGLHVTSAPHAGGWTLDAEIPLEVVGLAAEVSAFVFELVVTATPKKGGAPVKAQIATPLPAHRDSHAHVEVTVTG